MTENSGSERFLTFYETYARQPLNKVQNMHKQVGDFGPFEMWINTDGIANLLSLPQLERDGFTIDYNTKKDWVLTTPEGQEIVFKRDTGVAEGMPYIDIREQHLGSP